MVGFKNQKDLVRAYYSQLDKDPIKAAKYCAPDALWRGYHPFNEIADPAEVAEKFWLPLKHSLTKMQRRMDLFMAGENKLEAGGLWVASMGHLMGLFDNPWINIKHTNKIAMLRYCEFSKIIAGKIAEVAMFFDIPHLMKQVGLKPFPSESGKSLVQPGPIFHNGLLYEKQNFDETKKTSELIQQMINDLKVWKSFDKNSLIKELRTSWNEDMIWWGPTGIGSTYTIERYAEQHALPFRNNFTDRKFNGHICLLSEGLFGGFFGWPNLTLTPNKKFLGLKTIKKPTDMRVIDIYRREGNKLSENWVFIDFLHFWKMQGIDILK